MLSVQAKKFNMIEEWIITVAKFSPSELFWALWVGDAPSVSPLDVKERHKIKVLSKTLLFRDWILPFSSWIFGLINLKKIKVCFAADF